MSLERKRNPSWSAGPSLRFFIGGGKCPSRGIEARRIQDYLLLNGWEGTESAHEADLVVLSTCAYCIRTEKASVEAIRRLYQSKSDTAEFVVCGCLPGIAPDVLDEFEGIQRILPGELDKLDLLINPKVRIKDVPEPNNPSITNLLNSESLGRRISRRIEFSVPFFRLCLHKALDLFRSHSTVGHTFSLKLGTGCLGRCSYCAIRFATGELKSEPKDRIVDDFRRGLAAGFNRFALIGQDTGAYGIDIQSSFIELFTSILEIEGDYRLIITDFNAKWLIRYFDDLLPLLMEHRNRIEEMSIPIQSGSNRILHLMRRRYDICVAEDRLRKLMHEIPELNIGTHIMVGFPGETDEDFNSSKKFVEGLDFHEVGVFIYEDRPNIEAFGMKNKVSRRIARRRANIISLSARRRC